jgi:hypothetical protein
MTVTTTTAPPDCMDLMVRFGAATKIVEDKITGDPVSTASIYRWTTRGLYGIKLRTGFAGGHRRTTERWLREFFDAVTAAANTDGYQQPKPRLDHRADALARAQKELEEDGI